MEMTENDLSRFPKLSDTATSHIGFRVPDVEATADFYCRVLGMHRHADLTDGGARLGWGAGHHVIDLHPGEQALLHYGFEVRDAGGVQLIRDRLKSAGVAFDELDPSLIDDAVGEAEGIVVADPDGTPVHFHGPVLRSGENSADTGRRPIKFQHTTVGTADPKRMADFFLDVLGFRLTDQLNDDRFFWLRSNRDHHTLAIVHVGQPGILDHYSYDLAEWEDFKAWCDRLTELGVAIQWGPGRHGPGNNLFVFFDDPAGTHIELSAEMEKYHDDRAVIRERVWTPMPETINVWGGQLPKWRKVSGGVN
jgi:catechol 2,3-dioxygenase-like lactoylglutathione lyase family enzyme